MHVYRVTRTGRETLVTRGGMDASRSPAWTRGRRGSISSRHRTNATQRYLYRAPLDGSADPVRVTPRSFAGTNTYDDVAERPVRRPPRSRASTIPASRELVSLPDAQSRCACIGDGAALQAEDRAAARCRRSSASRSTPATASAWTAT